MGGYSDRLDSIAEHLELNPDNYQTYALLEDAIHYKIDQLKKGNKTMDHLIPAAAILKTAKIREDSYDRVAAENAAKLFNGINDEYGACIDYSKFYTKTLEQSVEEATKELELPENINYVIWLLLFNSWNDIIAWAETTKAAANE